MTSSLTGNFERSIPTNGLSQVVSGHAGVDAFIRFAPAPVYDPQEEEGAAGQEHPVRAGVILVGLHTLPIFIPLYAGSGSALCLAVEGGWLPLGDDQI